MKKIEISMSNIFKNEIDKLNCLKDLLCQYKEINEKEIDINEKIKLDINILDLGERCQIESLKNKTRLNRNKIMNGTDHLYEQILKEVTAAIKKAEINLEMWNKVKIID